MSRFYFARSFAFIAVGCLTLATSESVTAQDEHDPISLLERTPPEFFTPGVGTMGLESLEWRIERDRSFAKRLDTRLAELSEARRVIQAESEAMQSRLPIQFQFASDTIKARVVGRCLEELLAAQLDIATNETLIAQLEIAVSEQEAEAEAQSRLMMETRLRSLEAQLALAQQERSRLEVLAEKGLVSQRELSDASMQITTAEANLIEARLTADREVQARVSRVSDRLVDLRMESAALRAREHAAQVFLERMSSSTVVERELDRLRHRASTVDDQIRELTLQHDEVLLRVDETLTFADAVRRRLDAMNLPTDTKDDQ